MKGPIVYLVSGNMNMLEKILAAYEIRPVSIEPHGKGLINRTWLVNDGKQRFILQKINQNVFKEPNNIADNIELVDAFLQQNHPDYFLPVPLKTKDSLSMVHDASIGYFRLFSFVENSRTYDVVQNADQAFEAARQFGLFTHNLSALPLNKLKITLPGFHDLVRRYDQFESACNSGNPERRKEAENEIRFLKNQYDIVGTYKNILDSGSFRLRVTHHDTKISNVLFDKNDKAICVIDLDTVMPGYFISDVGDMLRTYLSPLSEEANQFSEIEVRDDYFEAIVDGYLSSMKDDLSPVERKHFVYAGKFMIYMQAIRFLTDHLNDDVYYGASYEGHNYVRAKNQVTLLKRLMEKEDLLKRMIG